MPSRRRSSASPTTAALRTEMGLAAGTLARAEHDVDSVAELYAGALERAAGGEVVREAVVREVADAAAETGIAAGDPEAAELTSRLREVGLGE